jgi:hypothetical protein
LGAYTNRPAPTARIVRADAAARHQPIKDSVSPPTGGELLGALVTGLVNHVTENAARIPSP